MARPVLSVRGVSRLAGWILLAAAVQTGGCARESPRATGELPCTSNLASAPETLRGEGPEFRARVEASPFFREALARHGAADACELRVETGALVVSFRFPGGGEVRGSTDPSIETSDLRATLRGIDEKAALALLRNAERAAYGEEGCGIRWNDAAREPSILGAEGEDTVFRGDVCNCQARMSSTSPGTFRLLLRSAC